MFVHFCQTKWGVDDKENILYILMVNTLTVAYHVTAPQYLSGSLKQFPSTIVDYANVGNYFVLKVYINTIHSYNI